jgi:molybdopterin-guanine dinucleotide biosynthesis protein B
VIKHAHHGLGVERPGKDSHRHRLAGASEVLLSSAAEWDLKHEGPGTFETELSGLLQRLSACDLVLVEGFKSEPIAKIEVNRAAAGTPLLFPGDPRMVAVASDVPVATELPVFRLDDHGAIAGFVVAHLELA